MIPHVEREYHNYVGKQMIFKKKIKKKSTSVRALIYCTKFNLIADMDERDEMVISVMVHRIPVYLTQITCGIW